MLSSTLEPIEGQKIGEHPLVVKLLKGCFNLNPPTPKYSCTWDVNLVLDLFRSWAPNKDLSLPDLSRKAVVLLALCLCLRTAEIASINEHSLKLTNSFLSFCLTKPRKAQKSGHLQQFRLNRCEDEKVCPVAAVQEYRVRTASSRPGNGDRLFISLIPPFRPVGGSSVARWIKILLGQAGVDVSAFTAHSTRGAAASKALVNGVSMDSILKTAHWTREATFARFYNRPIAGPSVEEGILNGIPASSSKSP